jgi:predicted nucleic acid-binding protein
VITALDTNVLLDVWLPDPVFGPRSSAAIMLADDQGGLVICEVVYAELATRFASQAAFDRLLDELDIKITPVPRAAAYLAGRTWNAHRAAGGKRDRIMADFLIGAHASVVADQFISRDQGFYRRYFSKLKIVDPSRADAQ